MNTKHDKFKDCLEELRKAPEDLDTRYRLLGQAVRVARTGKQIQEARRVYDGLKPINQGEVAK